MKKIGPIVIARVFAFAKTIGRSIPRPFQIRLPYNFACQQNSGNDVNRVFRIMLIITLFCANPALAQGAAHEEIKVTVKGMVCDFCAQGLQKTIGKREEVSKVEVDLDKQTVTIDAKPGQELKDETVKELITGNGFSVISINRKECSSPSATEC